MVSGSIRRGFMDNQKAKELLRSSNRITSAKVYEGGLVSEYALALISLRSQSKQLDKEALELFETSDSVHGKIYALIMLHESNRAKYRELRKNVNKVEQVNVMIGCVVDKMPVSKVLELIENDFLRDAIIVELTDSDLEHVAKFARSASGVKRVYDEVQTNQEDEVNAVKLQDFERKVEAIKVGQWPTGLATNCQTFMLVLNQRLREAGSYEYEIRVTGQPEWLFGSDYTADINIFVRTKSGDTDIRLKTLGIGEGTFNELLPKLNLRQLFWLISTMGMATPLRFENKHPVLSRYFPSPASLEPTPSDVSTNSESTNSVEPEDSLPPFSEKKN
jgi:hypothetical protein